MKAHSYSLFFCVGLPDIALKCEQLAAALLLYEREDVLATERLFGISTRYKVLPFSTLNVVVSCKV